MCAKKKEAFSYKYRSFVLLYFDFWTIAEFRKYAPPYMSPSKYKPPQTGNAENNLLNRPSKYKPPRGLVFGKLPSNIK